MQRVTVQFINWFVDAIFLACDSIFTLGYSSVEHLSFTNSRDLYFFFTHLSKSISLGIKGTLKMKENVLYCTI